MSTIPPISSLGSAPLMTFSSPAASSALIQSRKSLLAIARPRASTCRAAARGRLIGRHHSAASRRSSDRPVEQRPFAPLLLDFQVCVLDDLAPLCGLGLDVCGEVIRISRDYLQEARRQELLLKFSVREDLLYVGIDFPHHVARGLAGSEQSEPAHRLELRNAALGDRGHIQKLRETPGAAHSKRSELSRPDRLVDQRDTQKSHRN